MPRPRRLDIAVPESRSETPYPGISAIPPILHPCQPVPARTFADCGPSGLSDQQIAEYRHRLARGFYGSPAVVREVARRILDSGDF